MPTSTVSTPIARAPADDRVARACRRAAAVFGASAVAGGAFGAHALRSVLDSSSLAVFETAIRYQFWHALALLALGFAGTRWTGRLAAAASACLITGVVVFCGSLTLLALTGVRNFGWMTPFGGAALLAGWLLLGAHAWRGTDEETVR